MITLNNTRITGTRIQPLPGWTETSECRRCGIIFNTRSRRKNDQTHCRDCKPYQPQATQ